MSCLGKIDCFAPKPSASAMEDVDLDEGELIVVPRGVEHRPVALTDSVDVLLLERASTLNTGTADVGDLVHDKSKAGVALTKRELERIG